MARRTKIGRRASPEERDRVATLINHYYRAQSSPDRRFCLNPEDESEFQIWFSADDDEWLIEALQSFVQHGTFELVDNSEPFFMRIEIWTLRNGGMTYEDAIAALAEKHNASASTITRLVSRTVKT